MDPEKEGEKTEPQDIIESIKILEIEFLKIREKLKHIKKRYNNLIKEITQRVRIPPEILKKQKIYLEEKKTGAKKKYVYIRFLDGTTRRSVYVPNDLKTSVFLLLDIKEILKQINEFRSRYNEILTQIYDMLSEVFQNLEIVKEKINTYYE
ncbi:MAG: hypothetical protein Q6351_007760 [Candidatus Njordarchaeum guaymaensis]